MGDNDVICIFCGVPFDIKFGENCRQTNHTPNISPSLQKEDFIITCPYCHLQWNTTTGKEVLFSDV